MERPFAVMDRVRLTAHDFVFSYFPVGSEGTVKKIFDDFAGVSFDVDPNRTVLCAVHYDCLEKIRRR